MFDTNFATFYTTKINFMPKQPQNSTEAFIRCLCFVSFWFACTAICIHTKSHTDPHVHVWGTVLSRLLGINLTVLSGNMQ